MPIFYMLQCEGTALVIPPHTIGASPSLPYLSQLT